MRPNVSDERERTKNPPDQNIQSAMIVVRLVRVHDQGGPNHLPDKTIRMEFETLLKPKLKVVNLNYVYRTRTEYTLILDLHKQDLHHIIEVSTEHTLDIDTRAY